MRLTQQQCMTCEAPIIGDTYHLILGGSIHRFCCHMHRQNYASAAIELLEPKPRKRFMALISQGAR